MFCLFLFFVALTNLCLQFAILSVVRSVRVLESRNAHFSHHADGGH
jgi:hypothetical protein